MYELSTKIPKADLIQMVWFFRFFVDFKFVCLFKRKKLLLCLKKIESFFHHFQSNIVVSIKFFSNVLLFFSCEFFMLIILRILQNFFKNFTKFEVVIHADKPLFLNLKLIIKIRGGIYSKVVVFISLYLYEEFKQINKLIKLNEINKIDLFTTTLKCFFDP